MSRKNRKDRAMARQDEMAMATDPAELEAMEQEEAAEEAECIDFDGWWAARATKIPSQHHKEIIKADFRGRGLSTKETMEDFDAALKLYGIKLS